MMINNVDVNNRLLEIYSEKWAKLCIALNKLEGNCEQNYENNPLLLRIDNSMEYERADLKIMIFGQDMSHGEWYKYDRLSPLEECMNNIKTFRNSIGAVDKDTQNRQNSGFGGGVNRFINLLHKALPGCEIQFVWNDLVKIGRNIKSNPNRETLEAIEKEHFNVIIDEINCLQPDYIIFMTGPTEFWESRLRKKLKISTLYIPCPGFGLNQLSLVSLEGRCSDVKCAFRTFHPRYIKGRWGRFSAIAEVIKRKYIFDKLIDELKVKLKDDFTQPYICFVNDENNQDQIVEKYNFSYLSSEWLSIGYVKGNYYGCITYGLYNDIELGIRRAPETLKGAFDCLHNDYPITSNIWWYCKTDIDKDLTKQNMSIKDLITKLADGLKEVLDIMKREL